MTLPRYKSCSRRQGIAMMSSWHRGLPGWKSRPLPRWPWPKGTKRRPSMILMALNTRYCWRYPWYKSIPWLQSIHYCVQSHRAQLRQNSLDSKTNLDSSIPLDITLYGSKLQTTLMSETLLLRNQRLLVLLKHQTQLILGMFVSLLLPGVLRWRL